jgi:SulP family sulfate permease
MAEVKHFLHTVRVAPRSDVVVLLSCFFLTVVFDMVVAVTAGVLLAALLFMRRMAEVSGMRLVGPDHPALAEPLPPGVLLYEVAGPLFFGAAQKAMSTLNATHLGVKPGAAGVRVVVLDLGAVPAIDATGLVSLESALERLYKQHIQVVLAGIQVQPAEVLERAGLVEQPGRLSITPTFEAGIERARQLASLARPAAA